MPLFEYLCRRCSRRFEALLFGAETAECPGCHGGDVERLLSTFAVGADGGSRPAPEAAAAGPSCGSCGDPRGPGACAMDD